MQDVFQNTTWESGRVPRGKCMVLSGTRETNPREVAEQHSPSVPQGYSHYPPPSKSLAPTCQKDTSQTFSQLFPIASDDWCTLLPLVFLSAFHQARSRQRPHLTSRTHPRTEHLLLKLYPTLYHPSSLTFMTLSLCPVLCPSLELSFLNVYISRFHLSGKSFSFPQKPSFLETPILLGSSSTPFKVKPPFVLLKLTKANTMLGLK